MTARALLSASAFLRHMAWPPIATFVCAAATCLSATAANLEKTAPTISITAPASGTVIPLALQRSVTIETDTTAVDVPVGSVSFYGCDSSLLGTVTAPPYSFQWNIPVPQSDHQYNTTCVITAQAQGTDGSIRNATVSLTLQVPPTAPFVSLVAPASEMSYMAPASPLLYATAYSAVSLTIQKVEFLDGESILATFSAPNSLPQGYAFLYQGAAIGTHSIRVRATDSAGTPNTSAAVPIYVLPPNSASTVSVTSPSASQTFVLNDAVSMSATVSRTEGYVDHVDFVAGIEVLATVEAPPYTAQWVPLDPGTYAIVAMVYDDLGMVTASSPVMIKVLPSARRPLVVVTAPPSDAVFAAGATIPIEAKALSPDVGIAQVEFYADAANMLGTVTSTPYTLNWTNPSAGAHTITAKVRDLNGASTDSTGINVSVSSASPVVALTSPTTGATFTAPATITLAADASEPGGSVSRVDFWANSSVVASDSSSPYTATWSNVASGSYILKARARDPSGHTTDSAPITITVSPPSNQPPTVHLTSPTDGQVLYVGSPVTIAASASDADGTIARVDLSVDGQLIASPTAPPYQYAWTPRYAGSIPVGATATDNGGAIANAPNVRVTVVANAPPTVSLVTPHDGGIYIANADLPLSVIATDTDGTIARVDYYAGSTLIATASSAPFSGVWPSAPAGVYTISAVATDNRGAQATSVGSAITVVQSGGGVATLSVPTLSADVYGDIATIYGTYAGPTNTGVVINGQVADTDRRGHFVLNNMPLASGANTFTAVLTTLDGQTTTQAINVSGTTTPPFQVAITPSSSYAPLTATLLVSAFNGVAVGAVGVSAPPNVSASIALQGTDTVGTLTFSQPGFYRVPVTIYYGNNQTYQQVLSVAVMDLHDADQMYLGMFGGMLTNLAAENVTNAKTFLSSEGKSRLGPVFDALGPNLATVTPMIKAYGAIAITPKLAEYALVRADYSGNGKIHYFQFVQEGDGVWRLNSM